MLYDFGILKHVIDACFISDNWKFGLNIEGKYEIMYKLGIRIYDLENAKSCVTKSIKWHASIKMGWLNDL